MKTVSIFFTLVNLMIIFNLEVNALGVTVKGEIRDQGTDKICLFGDDLDEKEIYNASLRGTLNAKKSCYYNFDACTATISSSSGKKFYCVFEGVMTRSTLTTYDSAGSKFVECDSTVTRSDLYTGSPIEDIQTYSDITRSPGTWLQLDSIRYNLKSKLPASCRLCGSNFASSCPGFKKTTCTFNMASKTCNFGTDSATNCVAPISAGADKKQESGFTYFCSANNRLVQCDGNKTSNSYSDILESGYTQIKASVSSTCRFYASTSGTQTCKLKSTSATDNTCQFGPTTTQNSTSSPLYKSCPDDSSEGTNTVNSRYIYCSPSNVKVSCTSSATYKELFSPKEQVDDTTGLTYYDYSGKTLTDSAKSSKGCELVTSLIRPSPGCSVNASSQVGDECRIPKDCFNDKTKQPTKIDLGAPEGVGGLYCINRGKFADDFKADVGTVYFCQAILTSSGYQLRSYDSISEIKTKSGVENVYLKDGISTTCSNSPKININTKLRNLNPLSPLGLIRSLSSLLYYLAIFYFILLILINAFSYVRAGEDPSKLKQIKESLFNTVAGFIFVIASGGVILYIINSFNP